MEFDAYRADMEQQALAPREAGNVAKMEELKRKFEEQKKKYDQLRADVGVKLKFLDENRVFMDSLLLF